MAKKTLSPVAHKLSPNPRYHQRAPELQAFGTVSSRIPLQLEEPVRLEMTERLNQLLADTMTLRDLYKKSHWQVAGPTFYQLHLLFDKHFGEQSELVDTIAERIQLLGGVSSRWRSAGKSSWCSRSSPPRTSRSACSWRPPCSRAASEPSLHPGTGRTTHLVFGFANRSAAGRAFVGRQENAV